MLFENITIINENFEIESNIYVAIKNKQIVYVGKEKPSDDFGRRYKGDGKLLMPGFVNAHAHSPMTLLRGYGENLALQDWLNKRIFPFEAKLNEERVYWGTLLAMAESIRYGIVSTTDMYYFSDGMARAILESGAKNNLSRSITNFTDADIWTMDAGKEMKDAFEKYHNAGDGRIKVDMSLHAEYTTTPKTVEQLAIYTKEIGANMHVHVSETKAEHESCKEKYKMTPVEYLNSYGLFDTKTTAAHCVWIEGNDYDILREKGVSVAVNPISNMKLSSGICDAGKLLENNINVAIGTDSVASNNSLNFIEEMKCFAIASKVKTMDPTSITSVEAIKAATLGGAVAQGREDSGEITEGNRADLIVMDISGPSMHPVHNLLNNILYSASGSDVIMTMVDGNILYENGEYKTIDIEKTIFQAEKATEEILKSL